MPTPVSYKLSYDKSWAIVIGVNKYSNAPHLGYACNDANSVTDQLVNRFNFPRQNVKTMLDGEAPQKGIKSAILGLVDTVGQDDRVVIFYAGHGHTRQSRRGEVGFLVPVDGDPNDLSTLLRWDELTRYADLIPAKHLLFIMDACYGGLAAMRALPPGATRFVRDMLSRYSRQVLTAGKADEVVADSGGPRHGNSMFTGHLLDALEGAAATTDGIISANGVMAYVYDRVAKDPHSRQSPHFGFLDGDGDLFFAVPEIEPGTTKDTENIVVKIPSDLSVPDEIFQPAAMIDQLKEYLAEAKHRIRLDDLITRELRKLHQRLDRSQFPLQTQTVTDADIANRLNKYESAALSVLQMIALISRWGDEGQQSALQQILTLLSVDAATQAGTIIWLRLRWYPLLLALYSGGIASIAGDNYRSLRTLFHTSIQSETGVGPKKTIIESTVNSIAEVSKDVFGSLPNMDRKYTPQSEYLFIRIQSTLEDLLFLGNRYEELYDRFEILYALTYSDITDTSWAPLGRFAWKFRSRVAKSPFVELMEEAKRAGAAWPPLRAGLFGGSYSRFEEVANRFLTETLAKLMWF